MLRRALPLLVLVAATLTACDDPSNVGLGLVGGEGGEPVIHRSPAGPFALSDRKEFAGGTAFVLAGDAVDPLLGTLHAEGYLDFGEAKEVGGSSVTRFRENTVTRAYLELPRAYLYGDTLSAVTFVLRPISDEFSQTAAPSDTTFATGDPITTFSYTLPDATVRVPLPDSWVAANDSTLRSKSFATGFHGFHLRAQSGNAVIGFEPEAVRLYAIAAQDTVFFETSKSVSTTERLSPPNLPAGYVLVQDGFPNSFRVELGLDTMQVRDGGLTRLALALTYDSLLTNQTPPNFVRPRLGLLELIGVDEQGDVLVSGSGEYFLRVTGQPDADGQIVFASGRFTAVGRSLLRNESSLVKSVLVQVPQAFGTLDAIVLHAPDTPKAPGFVLTVIPSE